MIRPPAFCLPFCLCLPAAGGQSLPVRKPGLREVAVRAEGDSLVRQQKVQQCTDAGTDAVLLMAVVPGQADCHESSIREREGRYDVRTVCYVHDNRVEAHVQLSGSFSTAYEGRFDVKYARPVRHNPGPTRFEGRWLGACTAGMRPGDMVLPNGVTLRIAQRRGQREGREGYSPRGDGGAKAGP